MRLGSDALKYPCTEPRTPVQLLESAAEEGLAGLFFRTMLTMSPTLDPGELADIRAAADARGLYLESGLGKVNPFGTPEAPELRATGDGDIVLGFRRMMEAAVTIGVTELWAATANFKPYAGRFSTDRFRTDVSWADQLVATEKFLHKLAPIARDLGVHINLETHEEITSFELVRLVEAVGPDVIGITFDTANVLQRAEHPVWAAKRIAPYVRQTHIKDAAVHRSSGGLLFQLRACGTGAVDFATIVPILFEHNPDLNLSLELAEARPPVRTVGHLPEIPLYDPIWLEGHPDLSVEELLAYLELVQQYSDRLEAEGRPNYEQYEEQPFGYAEAHAAMHQSLTHLREVSEAAGIVLDGATQAA